MMTIKEMSGAQFSKMVDSRIDHEIRNHDAWKYAKSYARGRWYGHDLITGTGAEARISKAMAARMRNLVDRIIDEAERDA